MTVTDPFEQYSRLDARRAAAISKIPLLKRMERQSLWAIVVLGVPIAIAISLFGPSAACILGIIGAALGTQLWHAGAWVALRRRLVLSGFRLCPGCGYDQSGLPARGRCPECGREYTHRANADLWIDADLCSAGEALRVGGRGESSESQG